MDDELSLRSCPNSFKWASVCNFRERRVGMTWRRDTNVKREKGKWKLCEWWGTHVCHSVCLHHPRTIIPERMKRSSLWNLWGRTSGLHEKKGKSAWKENKMKERSPSIHIILNGWNRGRNRRRYERYFQGNYKRKDVACVSDYEEQPWGDGPMPCGHINPETKTWKIQRINIKDRQEDKASRWHGKRETNAK